MKKNTETRAARACALVSFAGVRALDNEASAGWGLHSFALVEAAGRACAEVFSRTFLHSPVPGPHSLSIVVLAGAGNNAADALVMLRALVLERRVMPRACTVFVSKLPNDDKSPLAHAILSLQKIGVTVTEWESEKAAVFDGAGVIIDGIAGTGLDGPLRGVAPEMAEAVNVLRARRTPGRDCSPWDYSPRDYRPLVVSVDIPSGIFDGWRPGMPAITADATLAIEPQKLCLYTPAARPCAGKILPVGAIFPEALTEKYREAELFTWEDAAGKIPAIPENAYKYTRGPVEIRAGSPDAAGAAKLAALGAQAAGAGLVRLIVDPSLYPVIAPACSGIMAVPDGPDGGQNRFSPAVALLGPGWGRGEDRKRLLQTYLPLEEGGLPLILDADAIILAKDIVFHGNALLTPHPGEFAGYTGIPKDEILADPFPILRRFAAEKKVHILLKSHVLYAACPDGRIGVIDGMNPLLAAGGTGDVLAGFCAAIAARGSSLFDCACAAASLLIRAAESKNIAGRFVDPEETARAAAFIAGRDWLPHNRIKRG